MHPTNCECIKCKPVVVEDGRIIPRDNAIKELCQALGAATNEEALKIALEMARK